MKSLLRPLPAKRSSSPEPRRRSADMELREYACSSGTMAWFSGVFSTSTTFSYLLRFVVSLALLFNLSYSHPTPSLDLSTANPMAQLSPSLHSGSFCERVRVSGTSRLNFRSYASSLYVRVKASEEVPQMLHGNIRICFHRNASLEVCQCWNDDWRSLQKGDWKSVMSPYDTMFIDIKSTENFSGSIMFSVEEEFQQWRLFCFGIGLIMLIIAPIVSHWVPFYYSSSMALGVLLIILLILFQGMKLLPMGRKNVFYLTLYGSVLGIGSYIAHYFTTIVNSFLVSFGLSEEMHYPVSVFLLVGVALAGAALGYWIVRKFVLSKDGKVDDSIAQFVKWAMRIIAMVLILQISPDALLAMVALGACWTLCFLVTSIEWKNKRLENATLWQQRSLQATCGSNKSAEFLNRSANKGSGPFLWGTSKYHQNLSNTPVKGKMSSTRNRNSAPGMRNGPRDEDFYSSFHKMPAKKFSKMEWEDFTRDSTREALYDWASSPEVARWITGNALRMRLSNDSSSEGTAESSSGSSEETAVEDGNRLSLFKWSFAVAM